MSNAAQLLELNRARALTAIAERLSGLVAGLDEGTLRALGVDDVLRSYGEACAHVPFDVDTAEIQVPPEGWPDDEDTVPMGRRRT